MAFLFSSLLFSSTAAAAESGCFPSCGENPLCLVALVDVASTCPRDGVCRCSQRAGENVELAAAWLVIPDLIAQVRIEYNDVSILPGTGMLLDSVCPYDPLVDA